METLRKAYNHSVKVMWDDSSLSPYIDYMFAPWRAETANGTAADCIHIESLKNSYRIYSSKCDYTASSLEDAVYRIENALTLHFQELLSHFLQIHAACIECGGRGVLLCGAHGAGKSTLALTALSSGMKVLGDDIVMVDDNLRDLYAFPRPIKAKGSTMHMVPAVVPEECTSFSVAEDFNYIFYYFPPGVFYCDRTCLDHIVFPRREDTALRIRELGELETLSNLLYQGFNYVEKKNSLVDILTGLIRNARSYEITYRESWDLIEALKTL